MFPKNHIFLFTEELVTDRPIHLFLFLLQNYILNGLIIIAVFRK